MGLGDYPNFLSPNERHLYHVPRKDQGMPRRKGPHLPKLLRLLANRLSSMDLDSYELDEVGVGGTEDPINQLEFALINLAGDIAADNPIYD